MTVVDKLTMFPSLGWTSERFGPWTFDFSEPDKPDDATDTAQAGGDTTFNVLTITRSTKLKATNYRCSGSGRKISIQDDPLASGLRCDVVDFPKPEPGPETVDMDTNCPTTAADKGGPSDTRTGTDTDTDKPRQITLVVPPREIRWGFARPKLRRFHEDAKQVLERTGFDKVDCERILLPVDATQWGALTNLQSTINEMPADPSWVFRKRGESTPTASAD